MPINRALCTLTFSLLCLAITSCTTPEFKPTPEEIHERDYWGSQLAPSVREQVTRETARHTNWSEKRQVQWEAQRYQHIVEETQKKLHKIVGAPTTQPPLPY